jgi:hypothetical protein
MVRTLLAQAVDPLVPEVQAKAQARGFYTRCSRTVSRKELRRLARRFPSTSTLEELANVTAWRPKTRAACAGGPRPCPFVGCKFHLFLDVKPATGAITFNFPGAELEDLAETCALDVADRGGVTLESVGALMNLTRERVRQVGTAGLLVLRGNLEP